MNSKYTLTAFLACLAAIVTVVGFGLVAVYLGLKNPDAYALLAATVSGLIVVVSRFMPEDKNEN